MLRFRDFVPQMFAPHGLFREGEFESFDEALAAANQWLQEQQLRPLNVETVVLPNIWSRWEQGSTDPSIGTSGEMPSHWYQFIRVWYWEG